MTRFLEMGMGILIEILIVLLLGSLTVSLWNQSMYMFREKSCLEFIDHIDRAVLISMHEGLYIEQIFYPGEISIEESGNTIVYYFMSRKIARNYPCEVQVKLPERAGVYLLVAERVEKRIVVYFRRGG